MAFEPDLPCLITTSTIKYLTKYQQAFVKEM